MRFFTSSNMRKFSMVVESFCPRKPWRADSFSPAFTRGCSRVFFRSALVSTILWMDWISAPMASTVFCSWATCSRATAYFSAITDSIISPAIALVLPGSEFADAFLYQFFLGLGVDGTAQDLLGDGDRQGPHFLLQGAGHFPALAFDGLAGVGEDELGLLAGRMNDFVPVLGGFLACAVKDHGGVLFQFPHFFLELGLQGFGVLLPFFGRGQLVLDAFLPVGHPLAQLGQENFGAEPHPDDKRGQLEPEYALVKFHVSPFQKTGREAGASRSVTFISSGTSP